MALTRRTLLAAAALLPATRAFAADPITAGVSGPLTGPNAQYGAQWKRGFDLALDGINGAGGVKGRRVQYIFEDSQSDPQAVRRRRAEIRRQPGRDHRARGFLLPRLHGRLADLSARQAGAVRLHQLPPGLHQAAATTCGPTPPTRRRSSPSSPEFAAKLGFKRPAVLHLNTDWGRTAKDAFLKAAPGLGMEVAAAEGYLPPSRISARPWCARGTASRTGWCCCRTTRTAR